MREAGCVGVRVQKKLGSYSWGFTRETTVPIERIGGHDIP